MDCNHNFLHLLFHFLEWKIIHRLRDFVVLLLALQSLVFCSTIPWFDSIAVKIFIRNHQRYLLRKLLLIVDIVSLWDIISLDRLEKSSCIIIIWGTGLRLNSNHSARLFDGMRELNLLLFQSLLCFFIRHLLVHRWVSNGSLLFWNVSCGLSFTIIQVIVLRLVGLSLY